ncbi:hypothetical protein DF268_44530 [Streptomyces sp. V2]|nr:hypothetical protein DF268_44530 [Streptomyces sp. V2]
MNVHTEVPLGRGVPPEVTRFHTRFQGSTEIDHFTGTVRGHGRARHAHRSRTRAGRTRPGRRPPRPLRRGRRPVRQPGPRRRRPGA